MLLKIFDNEDELMVIVRKLVLEVIYKDKSVFEKLKAKTLKGLKKEIDKILMEKHPSCVNWDIYTNFPFE